MDWAYWQKQFTGRKIVFYILFHGFHVGLFALGWYCQAGDKKLAGLNTLNWSVWLSRGAALVLTVDVSLILLPMCKNLMTWLRPKVRAVPLDETHYFHRHVAYSLLFWSLIHTSAHYVNFFNVERYQLRPQAALQIHWTQPGGITGHIMLLCMVLMYTTSHNKIRQQSFETFYYTHHLFIIFLLCMYTHASGCFVRDSVNPYSPFAGKIFWDHCIGYQGWRWELWIAAIYIGERIYRFIQVRRATEVFKVFRHPYDAVEIQILKPSFKYKAGQWLYLNCPSVSTTQWHPFTITSCPFDPYVSVHVRQVGDWTKDLANALGAGPEQSKVYNEIDPLGIFDVGLKESEEMPKLRIDGPYGAPAEDVFENEVAVLVGTGIGVTPWASILKNIWHLRSGPNPPKRLRRVEFIWVCKDTTSFEWFQALLSSLEAQSLQEASQRPGSEFLRIHIYLTQRLDIDKTNDIILNSVGAEKDPLTELNSRTNYGRPNFPKLLSAMRDGIMNDSYGCNFDKRRTTEVGVYFCGPNVAARDIKKACKTAMCPQVRFKFWKEHF